MESPSQADILAKTRQNGTDTHRVDSVLVQKKIDGEEVTNTCFPHYRSSTHSSLSHLYGWPYPKSGICQPFFLL